MLLTPDTGCGCSSWDHFVDVDALLVAGDMAAGYCTVLVCPLSIMRDWVYVSCSKVWKMPVTFNFFVWSCLLLFVFAYHCTFLRGVLFIPKAESLDWRDKGAVTPPKDQDSCGSCWAFSTICGMEGAYYLHNGKLLSFSEANLVDCVDTCEGCNGGYMTNAFDYVIKHQDGQFMLEDDYPYMPVQRQCAFDKSKAVGHVSSYVVVVEGDENDLAMKCTEYGPVCVAIDASCWSFGFYKGGIYDEPLCSSTQLTHGVGCVGYGTESNVDYWIVKNSWGQLWGEHGYIRMVRKNNQCGIATMACVPIP